MVIRSGRVGVHPPTTLKEAQHMVERVPADIWGGGDGGFPIDMQDGRVFWFYGDSFTEFAHGGNLFLHSTAHMLRGGNFRLVNKGAQIVPNLGSDIYFWPSGGCRVGPNRILVTSGMVQHYPDGSWEGADQRSCYFDVTPEGDLIFDRWLTYWPEYSSGITFGEVKIDGDHIVAFGWGNNAAKGRKLYAARVPLAQVETESAWTIYDTPLRPENESGLCCSSRKDGDTWRVITHEPFFSRTVWCYESTSLTGPWSRRALVQSPNVRGVLNYVPHWHPEINLSNGKALITMSRQATTPGHHPYESRLVCLEVSL